MKRKNYIQVIMHILFCIALLYWFYHYSIIRPSAYADPYKEIISTIILLSILYVNLLVLIPKIYYKNRHSIYFLLSLFLVCISGAAEMWLVESNIRQCVGNAFSEDGYKAYITSTLFIVILRNSGFYLFFTMLGLYQHTKKNALKEKKAIFKEKEIATFLRCNEASIVLNVNKMIYFQQKKERTTIHTTTGSCHSVYSTLNDIEEYLEGKCIRINRNTLVVYDKVVSFSHDHLVVKNNRRGHFISLNYYKNNPSSIFTALQKSIPHLEEKNIKNTSKNNDFDRQNEVKFDKKTEVGNVKAEILEAISKNPDINALKLFAIFHDKIKLRTLRRRLRELKDAGKIEYIGSKKNRRV